MEALAGMRGLKRGGEGAGGGGAVVTATMCVLLCVGKKTATGKR